MSMTKRVITKQMAKGKND